MKILNIDMLHIKDFFHCFLALTLTIFVDHIYTNLVNVTFSFITFNDFRQYLLDIKDIVSTVTVILTCILMSIKLKRMLKNKK